MTDEEKDAVEWLGRLEDCYSGETTTKRARTLKSMLARPVLPEVPDIATLEAMNSSSARDIYDRLHAHLTAPRTKEVWHLAGHGEPKCTESRRHWTADDLEGVAECARCLTAAGFRSITITATTVPA
jgi:hypothetical protein